MKPIHLLLGVLLAASTLQAQTLSQGTASPPALPAPTPYTVVSRDANSAVWQRQTYEQAPDGTIVPRTHQFVELATGLNHLIGGKYVPSTEEIDISPDGLSAAGTNCQHQIFFPGNIFNGEIRLVLPNGQVIESEPIGLAYFDGSNSVLLATVTNSTGAILSSGNQVIYTNAFGGLNADLLYTYTKAGFDQDVVLREQPPDPVALGLNPQTTRIQVLTEFFNPPQPKVTAATTPTAAGNLEDDSLSFGPMWMGQGRAFLLGSDSPAVGVDKRWLTIQGRQFLIEEVPIVSVAKAIDTLPPFVGQAGAGIKLVVSKNQVLPPPRLVKVPSKRVQITQAAMPGSGLVLDYQMLNGFFTNYIFQGDMTYYISASLSLCGTNTFEGGAVIKYTNGASVTLVPLSSPTPALNWQASAYRPVVFTAKDDNSVGETISGSTGNPTNYYANPALSFPNESSKTLKHFRIAYAQQAVYAPLTALTLSDAQIVNCQVGIWTTSVQVNVENALFANTATNFVTGGSGAFNAQNVTFSGSGCLAMAPSYYTSPNLWLTNCILANVTKLTNGVWQSSGGNYNGLYNCNFPEFGSNPLTNTFYPFQTVGGGSYYLTNGCNFVNAGTTNIDPNLLTDIRIKTTYPPIVYSNATISVATTFNPQAQRDTDTPDLGYHYDPLDYAFGGCLAYSNITFTAGTAVGWFRTTSGYSGYEGQGLYMHTNTVATFQGTATTPDYWVRCNTVQEGAANAPWQGGYGPGGLTGGDDDQYNSQISGAAEVHLLFTRCSMMAGEQGCHFRDDWGYLIVRANHSEFYRGAIGGYVMSCYLTNCLMDRMYGGQVEGWPGNEYVLRNCTWFRGWLELDGSHTAIPISARDCAFDGTAFTIANYGTGTNADYDYNAYTNGAAQLPGGTHNVIVTNSFNWQTSWFGNYYQSTNSPLLNKGDVLASQVGLYHFTIQTNQVIEGTNIVSIGYHYVATDANGNPLSTPGDGIPDYLADANGNGVVDPGEISWTNYYSLNGLTNGPGLVVFTPLK